MNETQNYLRYLSTLNDSARSTQLRYLNEGLKTMRSIESAIRLSDFNVGDRVWFETKTGTYYFGTIQKLKTKNAEVLVTHWRTGTTLWTAMTKTVRYNVAGSILQATDGGDIHA